MRWTLVGIRPVEQKTSDMSHLNETNKREELEDKIKLQRERMQQAEACNPVDCHVSSARCGLVCAL
eukprot:scaffold13050_cov103-Skeletonema_dohrnii-CCMP3373.AAC.2